jgi:hypothetical protein
MVKGNLQQELARRVVDELVEELKNEARVHVRQLLFTETASYRPKTAGKRVAVHRIETVKRALRKTVEAQFESASFSNKKFKLGELCEANHDYQGTGHSLRYKISGRCIMCQSVYNKFRRQKTNLVEQKKNKNEELPAADLKRLEGVVGVNRKIHTLGALCAFNHNFESTGYSLRYKSTGRCVGCNRDYAKKYWRNKQSEKKKSAKKK